MRAQPTDWTGSANRKSSTVLLLVIGQEASNLAQFLARRRLGLERLDDELRRRPSERAIDKIAHQMLLRLFLGNRGAVQVCAPFLFAERDSFFRHDLEQLQRGGVR